MATHDQSILRAYRKMNLELAEELHDKDCKKIVYLDSLPEPDESNPHLDVLSSLEAYGYTSPAKVDHLECLLSDIRRQDLLSIITRYKESKEYKMARKKGKKRSTKTTAATELESQLRDSPGTGSNKWKMVKKLYTMLSTHTTELTQMMDILREFLANQSDDGAIDNAMEEFHKVAKDGEKFAENLHKVLRSMDFDSKRASSSSEDSTSDMPATDTETGTDTTPSPAASSQPLAVTPLTPKTQRRKPKPLPRRKVASRFPRTPRQYMSPEVASEVRRLEPILTQPLPVPIRPDEETGYEPNYEPGTEPEEDQDDSGIGHAREWTGYRANSEGDLLETVPQNPVADPDALYSPVLRKIDYCLRARSMDNLLSPQETATYTSLLPRDVAKSIYTTPTSHRAQDH